MSVILFARSKLLRAGLASCGLINQPAPSLEFHFRGEPYVELKSSHQNPVSGHLLLQLSPNSNLSPSTPGINT